MLDRNGSWLDDEIEEPLHGALEITLTTGDYVSKGIKWKRNRFAIVEQHISYGCCPTCFSAAPRGDKCTRCDTTVKGLYFLSGYPEVPEWYD